MSEQSKRQQRAMELLQIIGHAKRTAEDLVRDFTFEEMKECQVICFEGGYQVAWLAVDALRLAKLHMPTPGIPEAQQQEKISDPLYDLAVSAVRQRGSASISGIQRRFKIGYNRAARLIESMEAQGVVGPLQSNGSRELLPAGSAPVRS